VRRIAAFIVRRNRLVIALTAVITITAGFLLLRMHFNADIAGFITSGNERGEDWLALQEKYDTADPINVLASLPDGASFLDPAGAALLRDLASDLAAVEGVDTVASFILPLTPLTAEGLAASPLAEVLVSEDGRHTMLMVTAGDDPVGTARRVTDVTAPDGLEISFSGNPTIFASVLDMLGWFLLVIPPVVLGLLLLTFYATIGDRRLTILSIVPALLGSVWTFGLIFGLGIEIDIVTVIVPIFVIVMGSADGLHFVSHFQEEAEEATDAVSRVESALSHVGIPMILTTVSTAAGFLSLLATGVRPVQQLGLFAAIGITFAGIISFFFLPALISRLDIEPLHHTALLGRRVTAGLKALARRRWPAVALTIGLVAFAAAALPRLEVDTDQLFFFKDGHEVRRSFENTAEVFGGATPLMGEFVYDPAAGPGQLDAIRETSAALEALPGVRTVFSVADLPAEQQGFVLAGGSLPIGSMVSDDGLRFMMLPESFTTDDLRSWVDFAAETDEIRVLSGMPVLWDEIARMVLRAQVGSLLAAFVVVALMLLVSYRRVRETFASLIPLALTVATLLGFIAVSGIQLNLVTAVASSIVIGVGIDYAIHLVAAIDNARPAGEGYVLRAIDRAGRPIVANALGIAVGLTGLWLSPLKVHPQISMIMWVSMIVAALTALLIIPALSPRDGLRDPGR